MNTPSTALSCLNPRCKSQSLPDTNKSLIRHSRLQTKGGSRQRWRCKLCGSTLTARNGTPYHRLRNSASRFDVVLKMVMEGSSKASIARVQEISVSTVQRWIERAAKHASAFTDRLVRELDPVEIQADELRGCGPSRQDRHYVFATIEVNSRLWVSQQVGGRTMRNCRLVMQETRRRCAITGPRTLIVTDPFRYYREAIRKSWGTTCVHVESKKCLRKRRVVAVKNELVLGNEWHLEQARARSEDSKVLNTAYIERLNLFARRALACLHRRTTSLVRSSRNLKTLIDLLQCYYNFARPHSSLKFGGKKRTPAMQAGLVTQTLSLRQIFMSTGPLARVPWIVDPKGREGWRTACGNNS